MFLVVSIIAGLVLGVVLSRQASSNGPAGAMGTMPSADAIHSGQTTGNNKAGAAPGMGTGMGTGAASGKASAGAGAMAGHASASAGGTSTPTTQAMLPKVTPMAPVSPYLRYTTVVAGTGCVTLAAGQYECMIGRDGGAPVFQAGTLTQTGTVKQGDQPFYCQASGAEFTHGGFSNHWWAWTESDQGNWGWVSAVDIAGGTDNQPEPGLPYCGG